MHAAQHQITLALFLTLGCAGATVSFGGLGAERASETSGETAPPLPGIDAKELFLANCASCHGELGDGKGTTELDRPARSFKDGGFSYGNTPDAIFRTLTYGIPGTPMPSFGTAFDDAQREALADYVVELGPGLPPPPENTEMVVKDRAVVVRGMLPPLTPEAVLQPRALAIGLPSGMSFEYRTDDVRLLGVRQGLFVDRTDWVGRGGTPLKPLGQVVHSFEGGNPGASFWQMNGSESIDLHAKFKGSWVRAARAGIKYDLQDQEGVVHAQVSEECESVALPEASGFRRKLVLSGMAPAPGLFMSCVDASGNDWETSGETCTRVRKDGRLEVLIFGESSDLMIFTPGLIDLGRPASAGEPKTVVLTTLFTHEASPENKTERDALINRLREELAR